MWNQAGYTMQSTRKTGRILSRIISAILIVILIIAASFQISVKPGVFIISQMFKQPVTILDPEKYASASLKVKNIKNISYTSTYTNNTMDIYYPEGDIRAKGILFWVHGGGFVAGDKEAIEEFATYVVAHNQIAVAAINYEKAPELTYPGQVHQLDDAFRFLQENHAQYLSVDFTRVLFGGDSAGGQIAGQYVALQTNDNYSKEVGISPSVSAENIVGFISYSAPVQILQMKEVHSDSFFMKFFVNTVARAFIGTRNWRSSEELTQASVAEHLTRRFPPTFITDGNAFSFQEQGIYFEEKLRSLDVKVESLFFVEDPKEIPHEYQFNYKTEEALTCLDKTINFIDHLF